MDYDLHAPCAQCPFRSDIKPFINAARAREILTCGAEFACHKTLDYANADDDGEARETKHTKHCAGVLIILEREEQPHQMMRISERLGMYDASKLKMDAPVYDSIADAVRAHKSAKRRA